MKITLLSFILTILTMIHTPVASQTQEHLAVGMMQFFDQNPRLNSEVRNEKIHSEVSSPSESSELDIWGVVLLIISVCFYGWTLWKWKWDWN